MRTTDEVERAAELSGAKPVYPDGIAINAPCLTLREHYAGIALQGLLASTALDDLFALRYARGMESRDAVMVHWLEWGEDCANLAVGYADALLVRLQASRSPLPEESGEE